MYKLYKTDEHLVHYDLTIRLLRAWRTDSFVMSSNTESIASFSAFQLISSDLISDLSILEVRSSLIWTDFVSRKMLDLSFEQALSLTLGDVFDDSDLLRSLFSEFDKGVIVKWYLNVSEKIFADFRNEYPAVDIDSHFDW